MIQNGIGKVSIGRDGCNIHLVEVIGNEENKFEVVVYSMSMNTHNPILPRSSILRNVIFLVRTWIRSEKLLDVAVVKSGYNWFGTDIPPDSRAFLFICSTMQET